MSRSQYSHEGVLPFYLSRIEACKEYGAVSGDEMNMTIMRCAFHDSFLTDSEYAIILNKCWEQHTKFMEDMRDEGFWGKRFNK